MCVFVCVCVCMCVCVCVCGCNSTLSTKMYHFNICFKTLHETHLFHNKMLNIGQLIVPTGRYLGSYSLNLIELEVTFLAIALC